VATLTTAIRIMNKIKILIVDENEHVRQGLRLLLELRDDLEIVGEACNGIEALQMSERHNPDVVLIDLEISKLDGFETIHLIKKRQLAKRVVVLTIHDNTNARDRAALVGADAFFVKGTNSEMLVQTIRTLLSK
jgi:two-component system response regulator DegU